MSAEPGWQEDSPKKHDDSTTPQAFLSWMQTLGSPENPAFPQEPESAPDNRPEAAPDDTVATDEIQSFLLHAIQDTEIARRLGGVAPAGTGELHVPAPVERSKTSEPLPVAAAGVVPPPFAPVLQTPRRPAVPRIAAVPKPACALLVQAAPRDASMRLMPAPRAPSRGPVPIAPKQAAEARSVAKVEALSPPKAANFPQSPTSPLPTSSAAPNPALTLLVKSPYASSTQLMPPRAARPRRPVHTFPTGVGKTLSGAVIPQVLSSPLPATGAHPVLDVIPPSLLTPDNNRSPGGSFLIWGRDRMSRLSARLARSVAHFAKAGTQLSTEFKNWIFTIALPAAERTARIGFHLSIEFKSWTVTKVIPAAERTARIGFHLSIELKNWTVTTVVPAAERMGRSATRLSIRPTSRAVRKVPVARETTAEAKSLISTGLRNWLGPRNSPRLDDPPAVAYCWTADTPHCLGIANISSSGIYLLTDVRWPRGGIVSMTLQRTDSAKEKPDSWIVIDFMVVRYSEDGVAGAFIPSVPGRTYCYPNRAENCADKKTLKRFVKHLNVPACR